MTIAKKPAGEPVPRPAAKYPQVMRLCAESPWAILPSKLAAIREMLTLRASGERFTDEEIQARIGSGPAQKQRSTTGTVAVLPLYGVITPKADLFTEMSGGTSVQGFSESFRAALADPAIDSILIDIDSPGGHVDLVPELATEIRDARGIKPIVAIANTDAASAAYWIGASADEFVVTPSGMVGSIGVFAAHDDLSAAMEQEGVKTTLISAGKYKVEGNPFEPLSDEARAAIQERVDKTYGVFVDDVALSRGVSASAVSAGFGEGRIVNAQDALAAGMVDRIDTLEATVERMISDAVGANRAVATQVGFAFGHSASLAAFQSSAGTAGSITTNLQTLHTGAASSGPSFVQRASAVRDGLGRITAEAEGLMETHPDAGLTAAKRDVLVELVRDAKAFVTVTSELLAVSVANPGADALAQRLLADARSRHFPTIGAAL